MIVASLEQQKAAIIKYDYYDSLGRSTLWWLFLVFLDFSQLCLWFNSFDLRNSARRFRARNACNASNALSAVNVRDERNALWNCWLHCLSGWWWISFFALLFKLLLCFSYVFWCEVHNFEMLLHLTWCRGQFDSGGWNLEHFYYHSRENINIRLTIYTNYY